MSHHSRCISSAHFMATPNNLQLESKIFEISTCVEFNFLVSTCPGFNFEHNPIYAPMFRFNGYTIESKLNVKFRFIPILQ